LSVNEQDEIDHRKYNVIIKGICENEISDKEKVLKIFECLKIDGQLIKSMHRIGKKTEDNDNEGAYDPSNDNEDDEQSKPRNRYRPIHVVLDNEDAKWKIVKSAPNKNKRAHRALGRSPEEKVKGHSGAIYKGLQRHNLNNFGRGPLDDAINQI